MATPGQTVDGGLKSRLAQQSREWYPRVPSEISSATGVFDISPATYLARGFGIKADKWLSHMIYGFPIVGFQSQKNSYPAQDTARSRRILEELKPIRHIFDHAEARFRSRS